MSTSRIVLAAVAAITAVGLAACGSSSDSKTSAPATSAPAQSDAKATACKAPEPKDGKPSTCGKFGDKPEIRFPDSAPTATTTQVETLVQGDGAEVVSGQILEVNYLGQVWGGEVFDNSYDRGATTKFPIGTGGVIQGWDTGLVGQKIGSRVMLTIPPAEGYGTGGNPQANITGTDTLVFVVDVVGAADQPAPDVTSAGQADATKVSDPPAGITVTGGPGEPATVAVAPGTEPVAAPTIDVLYQGTGAALTAGEPITIQHAAVSYDEAIAPESTWTGAGSTQIQAFEQMAGVPIGSRVLFRTPATPAGADGTPASAASAIIIDIVSAAS